MNDKNMKNNRISFRDKFHMINFINFKLKKLLSLQEK